VASTGKKSAVLRTARPTPAVTEPPRQHSLLPVEPLATAPAEASPEALARPHSRASAAEQLWLCLYLPLLPLESSTVAGDTALYAVYEERQGVRQVLQASAAAQAAGIHAGLSVNAALALQPDLQLAEREPQREHQVLQELANWAERYTSFVVVEPPAVLLLELAASLRLFAGLKRLRREIVQALAEQGYSAWPAIAPAPLAATWLARAGSRRCIVSRDKLNGALSSLPLSCLDWPAKLTASLQGMGLTQIGDLLRLPRAGFSQRFGSARLLELDRALGRLPDPRRHHRTPDTFCADLDLDGEHSDSAWLLDACGQLLQQLERFLLTRQLASQRLRFRFYHLREAATCLTLGCAGAEYRQQRWLELLRIRFEQTELAAAVIAIRLQASDSEPLTAATAGLGFHDAATDEAPISHLVERLAARMGSRAVHGVTTVAEHRPDYAWRRHPALAAAPAMGTGAPHAARPLWLLEQPVMLVCRDGWPRYQGPLELVTGPERIESGWWDEAGITRDYYLARNPAGLSLWTFRDRRGGGWYLHGYFG
jgi:protein ImuB